MLGKTLFVLSIIVGLLSPVNILFAQQATADAKPLRVGIVGLVHTHVHGILGRENKGDIEIVGIAEPNRALAETYAKQYGYSMSLVYSSMEEMINKTKPQAVLAFNSIFDHLKTVEYCAPLGIHVMVEKPLAVSTAHSDRMLAIAKKYNIQLITNYETSWYGSNKKAKEIIDNNRVGEIRKIVFHTGHQGPIEIGCNKEFLEWLTDPVLNGGGALTDFGCYGANITTWLMHGLAPISVTAITQQIKPDLYPKVEDEATIILTYPKAQVIIQASWNWPYSRKDMEVYGKTGYVFCLDKENMVVKETEKTGKFSFKAEPLANGVDDPFAYFANVVNGKIRMDTYDFAAPKNNEIVIRILEAAKESAKKGTTIVWKNFYKD